MKITPGDLFKKGWFVIADAGACFRMNNDLLASSSLAFSAMLALLPAVFLLTVVLGAVIGSSARAAEQTRELMTQLIPAYSQVILHEVTLIARHKGAISLVNLVVLFWSITPLVADLRVSLGTIFRRKSTRPFLLEKLVDAALSVVFLVGLAAVAVAGIVFSVMERVRPLRLIPAYVEEIAFFAVVTGVVFGLYFTFSKRIPWRHLLLGAVATTLLWFLLRPAFHAFLTFNPGYGFAFGSFKSLFVVIIWIYISLALFLFGAEITASLGRSETVHIKNLMEGRRNVPAGILDSHVMRYEKGGVIFSDGDPGNQMFSVIKGRVAIRKGERQIGVIEKGKSFGGLSFLLASPRATTAVALDDVDVVVLDSRNIDNLMNEFPEFVVRMLKDMALRLREENRTID
jgi:membrane protein